MPNPNLGATDLEVRIAKAIAEIMRLDLYSVSLSDRLGAVRDLAAIPTTDTPVDGDLETLANIDELFGGSVRIGMLLDNIRQELT